MDLILLIVIIIFIIVFLYFIDNLRELQKEIKEMKNKCIKTTEGVSYNNNTIEPEIKLKEDFVNLLNKLKNLF